MDIGSLNMENIENILGSMSNEDMEMLKSAAESFFLSQSPQKERNTKKRSEENTNPFPGGFDFETVASLMSVIEKLNSQPQDPRCNLLLSLKPMLSAKRQSKVDDAVKILSLMSILPIIDEFRGN